MYEIWCNRMEDTGVQRQEVEIRAVISKVLGGWEVQFTRTAGAGRVNCQCLRGGHKPLPLPPKGGMLESPRPFFDTTL